MSKNKDKKSLFEKNYKIILGILLLLIIIAPALFSKVSTLIDFNETTAYIGDTIGGITAPFVNLFAAILVFLSFKQQIQANKMQLDANIILNKETNYSLILKMIENFKNNFTIFKDTNEEFLRTFNSAFDSILSPNNISIKEKDYKKFEYLQNKEITYNAITSYLNMFQYITMEELNIIDEIKDSELSNNIKTTLFNQLKKSSYNAKDYLDIFSKPIEIDKKFHDEDKKIIDLKLKQNLDTIKGNIIMNTGIIKDYSNGILKP